MDELTHLALRGQTGDPHAFEAFVRRSQGEVWRFVAKMTDHQRADDLTQEVFLRAWKSLRSFEGASSARTWLFAIAQHVVADHVRATSRRKRMLGRFGLELTLVSPHDPSVRAMVDPTSGNPVEVSALEMFLKELPFDQRVAFVLTQVNGFTYAEVAAVCGVPVGTVRSRVARARDRLVAALSAAEAV